MGTEQETGNLLGVNGTGICRKSYFGGKRK